MADFNKNLWAPWRMEYIRSLANEEQEEGCFLCHYWQHHENDTANHVLWRTESVLVVLNRFPYTNGHLLIAPHRHTGEFSALNNEELIDLTNATRDAIAVLSQAFAPQGFNVGYNIGRCAGAGLPDHLHAHIVPRWNGDTNYMAVLGGIRVIPDALDATYDQLVQIAETSGFRSQNQ